MSRNRSDEVLGYIALTLLFTFFVGGTFPRGVMLATALYLAKELKR